MPAYVWRFAFLKYKKIDSRLFSVLEALSRLAIATNTIMICKVDVFEVEICHLILMGKFKPRKLLKYRKSELLFKGNTFGNRTIIIAKQKKKKTSGIRR